MSLSPCLLAKGKKTSVTPFLARELTPDANFVTSVGVRAPTKEVSRLLSFFNLRKTGAFFSEMGEGKMSKIYISLGCTFMKFFHSQK